MKPKVFLTRELPPAAMERLRAETQLEHNTEDRVLTKQEVIDGVKSKDALLCLLTDPIDAEVMDANPDLKVISNFAVGYNNIDVEAATARRIPVCNTPGVLTETTADMAFALLMATARRVVEGDTFVRSGEWKGWGPLQMLGCDIHGATLGIAGMGRIGRAVAARARGFSMKTIYYTADPLTAEEEKELGASAVSLDELLAQSDFLTLHVPYMSETHHFLGEAEFGKMKKTAIVINTSRGPVIDEKALVKALESGQIGGAGLDVFENEPAVEPGLLHLKNAVLAPHLGSATIATRTKMGLMAVENLLAACRGDRPPQIVNPEVLS